MSPDVIVTNLTFRQLKLVVEWFQGGSEEDDFLYFQLRELCNKCNED